MSEYKEALERYHQAKPFEIHQGFLGLSIVSDDEKEYKTLMRAVEKAEKYDSLVLCRTADKNERLAILDIIEKMKKEIEFHKEHKAEYDFWLNELRKENQELKQQKDKYKDMAKKAVKENPLGEPFDKLLEENRIIKDGIKALTKHYNISFNPLQIVFNQEYFAGIPNKDTDKIKAMLEVIKNE